MKQKSCKFIVTEQYRIIVPRPTSFLGGWARHQWLKKYFGKECSIASPDFWDLLVERHGPPKLLIEDSNGYRIFLEENT
jgi:hypothetical protein